MSSSTLLMRNCEYYSYNRLGKNAEEADVEEIIDMATKASIADQEKLVQENVHSQIKNFCMSMDEILLPDKEKRNEPIKSPQQSNAASRRSGLSLAVGSTSSQATHPGESPFVVVPII